MIEKKLIFRSLYNWKTLLAGFVIFVCINVIVGIFTPIGGCAGCIPNGNGGVSCTNECKTISPIIKIIASYILALLAVIFFSNKENNRQNIA